MRYALISDIHGNLEALESVLAFIDKLEPCHLLCLGDTVGYGADPEACLNRISSSAEMILAGNHDLAAAGVIPCNDFNPIARKAIEWTKEMLTPEEKEILSNLPLVYIDGECFFTHGSPLEPMQFNYVKMLDEVGEIFSSIGQKYCFVGHTHLPIMVEMNNKTGKMRIIEGNRVSTSGDKRFFVNVGSVGQPRDSNPDACAVIFDEDEEFIEFVRIPYDISTSQGKILSHGLPSYLAERLLLAR
jgi:diadenosine tetraphosphatase ApaH/serine/threonine PP2A family protein phosphatase